MELSSISYLAAFVCIICVYLLYYFMKIIQPVRLHVKEGSPYETFLHQTLNTCLSEKYYPPFWCFEARFQTVIASFIRSCLKDIVYRREVLRLPDGGEVVLDWRDNDASNNCPFIRPIVLILPGLTGDSQSEYIKNMCNISMKLGYRVVVFNYRGLGGHALKTPRTYCASNVEDLSSVIDHIKIRYPDAPMMAVGVSLGGVILGNYLASDIESHKLLAVMMLSVCWDPFHACESLEKKGLNLLLNRHLARCLINSVKKVKHHFETNDLCDLQMVFSSKTIKEFDSRFTIHQFGYNDVHEYYSHARLAGKLQNFKVPVLAINSIDDPFQPGDSIPLDEAKETNKVAILTTEYGGHIGFLEGFLPKTLCFSDRIFEKFAPAVFNNQDLLAASPCF